MDNPEKNIAVNRAANRAANAKFSNSEIEQHTRRWVEQVVVALNLCPFASAPLRQGTLRIAVQGAHDVADCLTQIAADAQELANAGDEHTTLIVYATAFAQFDDYLDFAAMADALLEDLVLDGIVQIATFHPDYVFEGSEPDDASNFSNRSPYPMLHLLRESAVEDAVERHPDTAEIPDNNIERLNSLGVEYLRNLLNELRRE